MKLPSKPIPKKQEQGAVPVNDCSEMTALSAGMHGKGSNPALKKARVPPHPQTYGTQGTDFTPLQSTGASTPTNVWHTRDRLHSFAKHGCFHTHNARRARVLRREYGCAQTHDVPRVYSFLSLMFIHPNKPILVTKGINPSLTES